MTNEFLLLHEYFVGTVIHHARAKHRGGQVLDSHISKAP